MTVTILTEKQARPRRRRQRSRASLPIGHPHHQQQQPTTPEKKRIGVSRRMEDGRSLGLCWGAAREANLRLLWHSDTPDLTCPLITWSPNTNSTQRNAPMCWGSNPVSTRNKNDCDRHPWHGNNVFNKSFRKNDKNNDSSRGSWTRRPQWQGQALPAWPTQ